MKKNILPEMIDTFRKERHLTLEELGEKLGKSKSAISRWCKGDRSPMIDDLEKLAEVFQTDVITLLYGKKTVSVSKHFAEIITRVKKMTPQEQLDVLTFIKSRQVLPRIPIQVVEALAAGIGYAYGDNETTTLYTNRTDLKAYDIASSVTGDSMEPLIKNNDVVLIKKDRQFISGNLFAVDYDGKSYLKKVFFEKDYLRLVSINDKYDDILIPLHTQEYLNIVGEIVDWFTPVE
ncbi:MULTISPECIES: XRE family transcriptional regulator [unclassified Granulicatella]|uniref:LexA family transcriptional regulator n=1 Tax=unclassified Granulicatella TaxID=2630493 RepID=UPI001073A8FF|nr:MULTISPECIES: XRE family transcriptional regulator [unclassified Granulicatella]MBF0780013.1 helix-turn-helix transcriptional regulator [Granulicatella sp. 19428wC4_WM01]TFU95939.1 XRE family transcriptional regulator [Granulicatella sp. WM01]